MYDVRGLYMFYGCWINVDLIQRYIKNQIFTHLKLCLATATHNS